MKSTREVAVFYSRTKKFKRSDFPQEHDVIVLSASQYTAYFKNVSFEADVFIGDERFSLGQMRFLLLSSDGKALYLNKVAQLSHDRFLSFPLRNLAYVSIGLGTEFYERLLELFDRNVALRALRTLNDWVVLRHEKSDLYQLVTFEKNKAFRMSLMRGLSSRRASGLAEGILFGSRDDSSSEASSSSAQPHPKFGLTFRLPAFERQHELEFDFRQTELPNRSCPAEWCMTDSRRGLCS
jgi:hypothetical protein